MHKVVMAGFILVADARSLLMGKRIKHAGRIWEFEHGNSHASVVALIEDHGEHECVKTSNGTDEVPRCKLQESDPFLSSLKLK
jgi:hypothetical protein